MKNVNLLGRGFRMFSLFLCIFMANVLTMFAQNNDQCPLDDGFSYGPQAFHSGSIQEINLNVSEPLVLNVFFWKVPDEQGNYGGQDFNQDKLLESIALLNINYNKFNIFFKYRGYDLIPSTPADLPLKKYEYDEVEMRWKCNPYPGQVDPDGYGFIDRCQYLQFFNWVDSEEYVRQDAMNVYVPYGSGFGGAASGIPGNKIILKINKLNTVTALHEFGHALGLSHTRSSGEHVTRDEFLDPPNNTIPNLDFNAKTTGDRIVDTAANPGFYKNGNYTYIDENCEYIDGFEQDNVDAFYNPTPDDVANMMTDAYNCVDNLITNGQGNRMREKIINSSLLGQTMTQLAALYEPYQGEYYLVGPAQNPADKPLFQPGFNYYFLECDCDCNEPTNYIDTSFSYTSNTILQKGPLEKDYSSITHPNHTAIGIKLENNPFFWPQPRRCYDNNNRKPHSGILTKFNDDVFNANVTITPQDSTAINNPTLVNDLPNGLYSIEKQYIDGSSEQTVIQKGNN